MLSSLCFPSLIVDASDPSFLSRTSEVLVSPARPRLGVAGYKVPASIRAWVGNEGSEGVDSQLPRGQTLLRRSAKIHPFSASPFDTQRCIIHPRRAGLGAHHKGHQWEREGCQLLWLRCHLVYHSDQITTLPNRRKEHRHAKATYRHTKAIIGSHEKGF